jgi:hypothetical protein
MITRNALGGITWMPSGSGSDFKGPQNGDFWKVGRRGPPWGLK